MKTRMNLQDLAVRKTTTQNGVVTAQSKFIFINIAFCGPGPGQAALKPGEHVSTDVGEGWSFG
jgi:hypothetical protein